MTVDNFLRITLQHYLTKFSNGITSDNFSVSIFVLIKQTKFFKLINSIQQC
jgi:hypothetical protein